MKKIFIIILFTFSIKLVNAQTYGVPDTLAYLQTIVANKANYIGQPFSILMDSLKIEIKYFHLRRGIHYDISKETSTRFSFYFPETADDLYLAYPYLEIYWQVALNANQSNFLWRNNNGGSWSSAVAAFYANGIIKDIQIRE